MKYIKISIVILLVSFISIFAYKLTTNNSNNKISLTKEQMKEMLSYTIDGNKTSSMPTKGSGYKVKSITCKSGSILSWDNDNWLLEVEKLESEDLCNIDFTTGIGSYTVSINSNVANSFDSTSKTTVKDGKVVFYSDYDMTISGCDYTKVDNVITISDVTSNVTCNVNIENTIYNKLLQDNPTVKVRTDFSNAYTENNVNTLFRTTEYNKRVFYFSGNAQNNWVKFGGYYWRIVRTNHDDSVRLIYHGTATNSQEAYIGQTRFNNPSNDAMYAGYMYGTSGSLESNRLNTNDSTIKKFIDNWYASNMTSYTKYLSSEAIYCNDREIGSGTYCATCSTRFEFSAYMRLMYNSASYDCVNIKDRFSVNNREAKLTYPIALLTADEAAYAGGAVMNDGKTYLYYNSDGNSSTGTNGFKTMTAINTEIYNSEFVVSMISVLGSSYNSTFGMIVELWDNNVRPVISLKGDNMWSKGDGSASNPYEIVMN